MNFTAIDFETATGYHPCSVGIVTVENGIIVDEFVTLIKPPKNDIFAIYDSGSWYLSERYGKCENLLLQVYPEIEKRLKNRVVVAHNESFDRNVLTKSMALYGLNYEDLNIGSRWECTVKIYKAKGLKPTKLSDCCREMKIALKSS